MGSELRLQVDDFAFDSNSSRAKSVLHSSAVTAEEAYEGYCQAGIIHTLHLHKGRGFKTFHGPRGITGRNAWRGDQVNLSIGLKESALNRANSTAVCVKVLKLSSLGRNLSDHA